MQIKRVLETKEGPVDLDLTVSSEEYNFILEVGLSVLLSQGALPFINHDLVAEGRITGEVGNA